MQCYFLTQLTLAHMLDAERERETETDRQTDRQTDTGRQTDGHRQTEVVVPCYF